LNSDEKGVRLGNKEREGVDDDACIQEDSYFGIIGNHKDSKDNQKSMLKILVLADAAETRYPTQGCA
jgi:hypothetical protein